MTMIRAGGFVAVVFLFVQAMAGHAQGPLTPTSAPTPNMKTLAQVEPRIPITELPFIIEESGSYYLATNLIGKSVQNGIMILANHVTLDLSGFSLIGSNSINAISCGSDPSVKNVVIRNGWIGGWYRALDAQVNQGLLIENIHAVSNGWSGGYTTFLVGNAAVIRHCTIQKAGTAIIAGSGSRISDCDIYDSSFDGINTSSECKITDCNVVNSGSTGLELGADNTVINCSSTLNTEHGFDATSPGSQFINCLAANNGIDGFHALTNCSLTECVSRLNWRHGFYVETDCRLTRCTAITNGFQGIEVRGSRNLVTDNLCNQNLSSGIFVYDDHNRIENNHVAGNDFGIYLFEWAGEMAASNMIVRNTAAANRVENYHKNGAVNFMAGIDTSGAFTNAWANFAF
jgi:parallel beta-helix repeat protein